MIGHYHKADITIAIIKGFMLGALYHKEQYGKETEYTLQCLIGIFSVNVIWSKISQN